MANIRINHKKSVLHFSIHFNIVQPIHPSTSYASSTYVIPNAFTSHRIIHIKRFQHQRCVKKKNVPMQI